MSTRSYIGKKLSDGQVKYIYCHFDGYPSHNGVILKEHYNTEEKVDQLLELGNLSSLGEEIGEKQEFGLEGNERWCVAFGRDRGESGNEANVAPLEEIIGDQSYTYVFENGEWRCWSWEEPVEI